MILTSGVGGGAFVGGLGRFKTFINNGIVNFGLGFFIFRIYSLS